MSVDHKFQLVKGGIVMPLDGLRDKLEELLQKKIVERNTEFIGEEAREDWNRPTIAQRLASTHNPQIPWQNIDMTEDQRKAGGIHAALKNRPCHPEWRGEESVAIIEHRIPEDDVREEYMVSKAIERAAGAKSILIVCGDMHTRALKEKFEKRGHRAEIDATLIVEKTWTE